MSNKHKKEFNALLAAIKQARTIKAPAGHYDEDVYYNGIDFAPQVDLANEILEMTGD